MLTSGRIYERIPSSSSARSIVPKAYGFKTLNGDLLPWRLQPRLIPMPEERPISVRILRELEGQASWPETLSGNTPVRLPANSSHVVELLANTHTTAFLKWTFRAATQSEVRIKAIYSEGYEGQPRSYPFFRSKGDRLAYKDGLIIGPRDEVTLVIPEKQDATYEPFWFRTFRIIRLEITVGQEPVEYISFDAVQTNYPLDVKASWIEPSNPNSKRMWDVSIRTLRNCMFDGYSDCPFYEQLQYSMDSRAVGLFHYLLSGDDRLMRQAITIFASSTTFEGLPQSRFPSHVNQLIAAFPLYWILEVCDHHLYFGDTPFARSFVSRIDGIFEFFDRHILADCQKISGNSWIGSTHGTQPMSILTKAYPCLEGRAIVTHTSACCLPTSFDKPQHCCDAWDGLVMQMNTTAAQPLFVTLYGSTATTGSISRIQHAISQTA